MVCWKAPLPSKENMENYMHNIKQHIRRIGSFIKKHSVTILPVFMLMLTVTYIWSVCACNVTLQLKVNGATQGYIASTDTVVSAVSAVNDGVYKASGGGYTPELDVSYKLALTGKPEYLTSKDCENVMWSYLEEDFSSAYMLYVDGKCTAACESGSGLFALLEEIESDLLSSAPEGISDVKFSKRMKIEKQLCQNEMIKSLDEISALLNPVTEAHKKELEASWAAAASMSNVKMKIGAFTAMSPRLAEPAEIPSVMTESSETENIDLEYSYVSMETVSEPLAYDTVYVADSQRYVGNETVVTPGCDGEKSVTYEILYDDNGNEVGRDAVEEKVITSAVSEVVAIGTKKAPKAEPTGKFIWPCDAPMGVTSYYGWRTLKGKPDFHLGIDMPDAKDSPIWAADGGVVVFAGEGSSYGKFVKIQHGNKTTVYAHLDDISVSVGDKVYQGQIIGTMGNTGVAYGVHLHFEIRINGSTVNPIDYLPKK